MPGSKRKRWKSEGWRSDRRAPSLLAGPSPLQDHPNFLGGIPQVAFCVVLVIVHNQLEAEALEPLEETSPINQPGLQKPNMPGFGTPSLPAYGTPNLPGLPIPTHGID